MWTYTFSEADLRVGLLVLMLNEGTLLLSTLATPESIARLNRDSC
jgi:hypothetical protein